MTTLNVEFTTLALSQQVLERQEAHANAIASYLPANADIGDSTGLLLAAFDPLSRAAVDLGVQAAGLVGAIDRAAAAGVGQSAVDFADTDLDVSTRMRELAGELFGAGVGGDYPDLGGPSLGPAGESAGGDYGEVSSYAWEKAADAGESVGGAYSDARSLIEGASQWGTPGTVSEAVDASSYLVPGQSPENFVQDLRWSAGALLGSIDWVAEQLLGYSILDRCVYEPLAGDWEGIYRASEAWHHAGDALGGIARNHASLVATTPTGWQGLTGDAFRVSMAGATQGALELGAAYGVAGDLTKTISTVCKLACVGIGSALSTIANLLLKKAAEMATPLVGWAVGAVTAYSDVNKIISKVRLIYTIIETVSSAIADFVDAQTEIVGKVTLLEDLLQGLAGSATS